MQNIRTHIVVQLLYLFNKGPCGTRLLNERLVFHIGEQVQELKKLVQVNKSTLVILRGSLEQPEEMKKKTSQLVDVQTLLQVCILRHK